MLKENKLFFFKLGGGLHKCLLQARALATVCACCYFSDENSESESDSDDRFKGKAATPPNPGNRPFLRHAWAQSPRLTPEHGEKSAGTPANRPSEQKAVEFFELSLSVLSANVCLLLPNLKQFTLSILPKSLSVETGY